MQTPDRVITRTGLADMEERLGIVPPLESLLAERAELVKRVCDLRARHGPGGTWLDLRKIELARIAQIIRAGAVRDQVKMTEAAINDATHADPRYIEAVTKATTERAELAILEDQITGIGETIMRQQMIGRLLAAEMRLAE